MVFIPALTRFYCLRVNKGTRCWGARGSQPACTGLGPGPAPLQGTSRPGGSADTMFIGAESCPHLYLARKEQKTNHPYLRRQGKCARLLEGPWSGTQNLNTEIHCGSGGMEIKEHSQSYKLKTATVSDTCGSLLMKTRSIKILLQYKTKDFISILLFN